MVTLIGFFFILGNVGLLALLVPDLIGPVRSFSPSSASRDVVSFPGMENIRN